MKPHKSSRSSAPEKKKRGVEKRRNKREKLAGGIGFTRGDKREQLFTRLSFCQLLYRQKRSFLIFFFQKKIAGFVRRHVRTRKHVENNLKSLIYNKL